MEYRGYQISNFAGRLVIFTPAGTVFQASPHDIYTEGNDAYGAIQCCKMIDQLLVEGSRQYVRPISEVIIEAYEKGFDYDGKTHSKIVTIKAARDYDPSLSLQEAKEIVESVLGC